MQKRGRRVPRLNGTEAPVLSLKAIHVEEALGNNAGKQGNTPLRIQQHMRECKF